MQCEDVPDSSSEAGESVLADDVLCDDELPPSPFLGPTPGSYRKLSRRRRFADFLLRRGRRGRRKKHVGTHPRKKHRGWIRKKRSPASLSSSSSDDASSGGSDSDSLDSLQDGRIGRPPMCGASYSDWEVPEADSYNVRQYDYKRTKRKDSSCGPPFYELCAVDTYCSPSRMDRIFEHIERLEEMLGFPPESGHPDIPRILIFNCQFPSSSPTISSPGDGPTINIVVYYKLRDEFRRYIELGLDHAEVPPAARLFSEWCANGEDDDEIRGRFKVIGKAMNTEELHLPSVIKRYNGKPILIYGREGSMHFDREQQILELCVNAHNFSYFGRRALYSTYPKFRQAHVSVGFLIEGQTNDELPEHVIGTALFRKVDLLSLEQLSWDSGTLVVGDEEDRLLVTANKCGGNIEKGKGKGGLQKIDEVLNASGRKRLYDTDDTEHHSFQQSEYLSLVLLTLVLLLWTALAYIWKNGSNM